MEIKELQKIVGIEYVLNGYMKMWSVDEPQEEPYSKQQRIYDLAEVGLWNTEVSEALEDIRKIEDYSELKKKWAEEGADVIIRVFNFFNRKGIDAETAIVNKHNKNMEREKLHGKVI